MQRRTMAILATLFLARVVFAATPPATVNYQGVLRSAADAPLTGTYDMTFRFYDALSGGSELLVDTHAAAGTGAVSVNNGIFNTLLGGGTVADGSGAGTYTNLGDVFRDYGAVYMGITVGAETLAPRVRVQAAAYALNATNLGGHDASSFLDVTTTGQTKSGPLTINATAPGQVGLAATGTVRGGWFRNAGNVTEAHFATNNGYGVYGYGPTAGGYFVNSGSGTNSTIAMSDWAFAGTGVLGGVYVVDGLGYDSAKIASNGYGVYAGGSDAGAYFVDTNNGSEAYLGTGGYGVYAYGSNAAGGYFHTSSSGNGQVWLAPWADVALKANITDSFYWAGDFTNGYLGNFSRLGFSNFKIYGNGSVSFVQNHPTDASKLIVYTAPEGDETAVYTRGTARLTHGEARVKLGETFGWVANPDVGLTAQLTPRGAWADLYIVSLASDELVVRSRDGGDAVFDYAVWGLRIGFEETQVVTDKTQESMIPNMAPVRASNLLHPELARYTALARFRSMEDPRGLTNSKDALARAKALHDRVGEYDPNVDSAMKRELAADNGRRKAGGPVPGEAPARPARPAGRVAPVPVDPGSGHGEGPSSPPANTIAVAVGETVSAGDLVAIDASGGSVLHLSTEAASTRVIGIVAGEAGASWTDTAPVAVAGTIVLCRVDATSAAIVPGDLLVASATTGHAMRAGATPAPGTIVGKALEPLEGGQALIRVLAMAR